MVTLFAIASLLVIVFVGTTFFVQTREQWLFLCATWVVVGTALLIVFYGVGNYWNVPSLIGKVAANAMAVACVIIAASAGVLTVRTRIETRGWHAVAGVVAGLVGVALSPVVGLLGACVLTRDCL